MKLAALLGTLTCLVLGSPLAAQTKATGAKAPAIIRDSIYAMAVDSARYPSEAFVYLLDDGVVRYEPSGTGSRTYRQVIQILKADAVEQWAEHSLSYQPDRERLVLNWARVVSPEGTVLSAGPEVSQDSDVPAAMESPVYQHVKVRRLTLAKVAPGTLVDLSYTIETVKPRLAGDFYSSWRVTTGMPVIRSRFVLDTPVGFEPKIVEENLTFAAHDDIKAGRRVRTWAVGDIGRIDFEPFASDSNGVMQRIEVGGGISWETIGAWYAGLARDRYAMTPALASKLGTLLSGAKTLTDSLRAVHKYVAKDVRYVAVSLGMGGYQPRPSGAVSETGFGDCKDKATLFVTLARAMGLTAYPVLLNSSAKVDPKLPSISQFDHAIAVLDQKGKRTFVDLTAGEVPFGLLPPNLDGHFGLIVEPDGTTLQANLPDQADSGLVSRVIVRGTVDTAGFFEGTGEMRLGGPTAMGLRAALSAPYDSTARRQMATGLAGSSYRGARSDSIEIIDKGDTGSNPEVRWAIHHGRAAQLAGNAAVLTFPFRGQEVDFSETIRELRKKTPRRFPIDIAAMAGTGAREVQFELTLPPGWTAEVPQPRDLSDWWGRFESMIEQKGQVLRLVERQKPGHGNLAPDRVEDAVGLLQKMQELNQQFRTVAVVRKP